LFNNQQNILNSPQSQRGLTAGYVNKNKMAVESFFVIETSFSDLREKLKEEIVRVDKEYDENTICYDYGLVLMLFKEFFQQKQIPLYILS